MQKIVDLSKLNIIGKAFVTGEEDSDDGNVEVSSMDSEDDEFRKPTHGTCYVAK